MHSSVSKAQDIKPTSSRKWFWPVLPCLIWGAYFTVVNTIGRSEQYTRLAIWGGGLIAGITSVVYFRRRVLKAQPETKALGVFILWTLMGLPVAIDVGLFWPYFRMLVQLLVLVVLLSAVIENTGGMNWIWAAFAVTATLQVLVPWEQGESIYAAGMGVGRRVASFGGGENTLGWYGFLGVLGSLILIGEGRGWSLKGLWIVTALASGAAVVASGSRGGFLASALCVILWPAMCLGQRVRNRFWVALGVVVVVAAGARGLESEVFQNTVLASRLDRSTTEEREKSGSRLDLLVEAVRVTGTSPVLGVGLGQFARVSGTGQYAHSEFAELAATTGVVGLGLYLTMYLRLLKRLNAGIRRTRDRTIRYRLNCAKMALLIVLFSGVLFQPHFLNVNSMFLVALIAGIGRWADRESAKTAFEARMQMVVDREGRRGRVGRQARSLAAGAVGR